MNTKSTRIHGFSLIELLVVMLVIGIVAAFLVPATATIIKGSQVSQASQIVVDQFNLARQYALAKNHPVQVRLIRYQDPEMPGEVLGGAFAAGSGKFRAIQIVDALDGGVDASGNAKIIFVPVDKPQLFPQAVIMDADGTTNLSTLIMQHTDVTTSTSGVAAAPVHVQAAAKGVDPAMPRGIGYNYDYIYFRFLPDGSTDLPAKCNPAYDVNGAWFVTLHNINDKPGVIPPNFFTLQVDPVAGTLKQFRPGI